MAKKQFQWEGDGLPTLTLGDYSWEGEILLPVWEGWACKAEQIYGGSGAPSTGAVEVDILSPDDDEAEPTVEQGQALRDAMEHQAIVQQQIVKAVQSYYAELVERLGKHAHRFLSQGGLGLPARFDNAGELKGHLRPSRLHIGNTSRMGSALVGYEFECSWDVEHGLGVLVHDKQVIAVGDSETAASGDEVEE